jgi:hypothetical protein
VSAIPSIASNVLEVVVSLATTLYDDGNFSPNAVTKGITTMFASTVMVSPVSDLNLPFTV